MNCKRSIKCNLIKSFLIVIGFVATGAQSRAQALAHDPQSDATRSLLPSFPIEHFDDYSANDVQAWVETHRQRSHMYIDQASLKSEIIKRDQELKPINKPVRFHSFISVNGLRTGADYYVEANSLMMQVGSETPRKLVDANELTKTRALLYFKPSPDGKWMA